MKVIEISLFTPFHFDYLSLTFFWSPLSLLIENAIHISFRMRNLMTFAYLPNPVDESYDSVKDMNHLLHKIGKQKVPAVHTPLFPSKVSFLSLRCPFVCLPRSSMGSWKLSKSLTGLILPNCHFCLIPRIFYSLLLKIYREDALAEYEKDQSKNEALSPDEQIVRKLLKYSDGLEALVKFTKKELSYENLEYHILVVIISYPL